MPTVRTQIHSGTPATVARLARALRRGELVAVPTETVYGLAGDALDPRTAAKIFRAKRRPANDPLIVHIHARRQLAELAEVNAPALSLARAFWPGPLTIVLPKTAIVPDRVTSGHPSVAVRMPRHRLFRALLKACGRPLAAPSANPFGYLSPTTAEHVRAGLNGRIRHILDGGPCPLGLESTIVDLRDPKRPALLRPGALPREEIERVLGKRLRTVATPRGGAKARVIAPGLLSRHYSPRTPMSLHTALPDTRRRQTCPDEAFVFLAKPAGPRLANDFWLDARGDLRRAARRLFATLREIDDDGRWKRLHVELARGDDGWAPAINDRLRRAAAK